MQADEPPSLLPTFRDPAGQVELRAEIAVRRVRSPFSAPLLAFLESEQAQGLAVAGDIVSSYIKQRDPLELEHPRIPFVSYPWEWPSAMWIAAGELTLRLCLSLLEEERILRDGTPLNVLFQGSRPVLVDILSVGPADPALRAWPAYGQFVRTFLLPLLALRDLGWPLAATIMRRDGYEPEELWPFLSWMQRVRRAALATVTIPSFLGRRKVLGEEAKVDVVGVTNDPELARYTVRRSLNGLRKTLKTLTPKKISTEWTEYVSTCKHYSQADQATKREFVRTVLLDVCPKRVLDVGCNTGEYSLLAAESGSYVVGIEADEGALNLMYARVSASQYAESITMVQGNLARPTPATGWLNRETLSLLDRCKNSFDLCLFLAVIHHLLLREQIPIQSIAALCAQVTQRDLLVEWIPAEDPMYKSLMRGRMDLYGGFTQATFLIAFEQWFEVVLSRTLNNGRSLFHMRRRESAP